MLANPHLAHLSDVLLVWAVTAYALAMLGYAAEFAFGRRDERAGSDLPVWGGGRRRSRAAGRIAVALTVGGWGVHVASVVTRGLAAHRVPWGNMYEFSSMVSLVAVTVFLVLLVRHQVRFLGAFIMAPVVLYLGLAGTVLYANAGPLVPALNSYWIKIHVVAAITASGAFMVSGVVTVLYLLKERWERRGGDRALSLGPGAAATVEVGTPPTEAVPVPASTRGGVLMRWLPAAESLDRLSYRVVAFAFPVWTFAIIAGAIWAESAWSRYWGWDPKETWSFITWLAYAAYLHARATAGWRGRRAAVLSLIGFGCLMVDYYVVNTVITGLHSYAGVS
ncbi:MAG TPA: c-type cytochrome biogenesis protein CcsB [Mycobacteriales bacterium]|nr:c-type cytochrome biogenesis protein CcsB [Mycobacteriales bacterium]